MINLANKQVDFALTAVQLAAMLADEIRSEMVSPALTKDDRSPVTVADFAAQAVVGYFLELRFPEAVLVGEENSSALQTREQRETLEKITNFVRRVIPGVTPEQVCAYIDRGDESPGDQYWTLDPIDGTKGFLRDAQYATALAFVKDGAVELGVLGCPGLSPVLESGKSFDGDGALLAARRGEGSWITDLKKNQSEQVFTEVRVSDLEDPAQTRILRSFESGHTNVDQIDHFASALGTSAAPVRLDSQVKYALLAAGLGEIYLRLLSSKKPDYKEKVWDQAAGMIIVEEAGGKVTDLAGKKLDFSQGRTLAANRGVCATNLKLHSAAVKALSEVQV
jgi:3'(2'), 5'-bisphosphate nucleotidase